MPKYDRDVFEETFGPHYPRLLLYYCFYPLGSVREREQKRRFGGDRPHGIFHLGIQMIQEIIDFDIHENGEPTTLKNLENFPLTIPNSDGLRHESVRFVVRQDEIGRVIAFGVGASRGDYKRMAWFLERDWHNYFRMMIYNQGRGRNRNINGENNEDGPFDFDEVSFFMIYLTQLQTMSVTLPIVIFYHFICCIKGISHRIYIC